jgi:ATP-binding cassette subfamily B multidrug efflux pump
VRRLARFYRPFFGHPQFWVGLMCIPIVVLCDIQITLRIGDALNRLRQSSDPEFLRGLFFLLLAIAVAQGVFRYLQRWWMVTVSRRFEVELKQRLFDKLCRLPLSFHTRSRSGDVVTRMTSDVENIRMLLGPGTMYIGGALIMVPGSLYVLFRLSPWVTLAMVVPLLLVAAFMKMTYPRLHRASTDVQESLADIGHRAQESFSGIRIVKGYGLEEHERTGFSGVSRANRDHQLALGSARGLYEASIDLAKDLAFLPILLVGGWAMIDRSIEIGDLFKFLDLGFKVFWPLVALGWMAGLYPRAVVSAERIDELLDADTELDDPSRPTALPAPRGALSLRRVSYSYPESSRPALSDVDIEVPAGTMLGVVGPTGSGKSTLLGLLGRLWDPSGEVLLDGVPLKDLPLKTVRGALAYVPQDSFLFSDTYRNNVDFGADDPLEDAELARVIDEAAMSSEVRAFPGGVEQLIGERGVTLSGGQRQRTSIARALAKNPRVLVLDDALSAVDTETEARLLGTLRRARSNRTVVVAAHRLATVRRAERIVVLNEGRVEAQGTHVELLERSPWYRRTWERQRMQAELEVL